jgi:hypothetical protein
MNPYRVRPISDLETDQPNDELASGLLRALASSVGSGLFFLFKLPPEPSLGPVPRIYLPSPGSFIAYDGAPDSPATPFWVGGVSLVRLPRMPGPAE